MLPIIWYIHTMITKFYQNIAKYSLFYVKASVLETKKLLWFLILAMYTRWYKCYVEVIDCWYGAHEHCTNKFVKYEIKINA